MLGRIAVTIIVLAGTVVPLTAGEMTPAKEAALQAARDLEGLTGEIARDLWDLSETALLEERSARKLMDVLAGESFSVEAGVAGLPTAFVATWGEGRPIVGILAEYDALPGVGNAAVPRRESREDGVTAGQGCGHNLFGAASVTGAIAAKRAMAELKLPGTIRVYGTPAEETVVGKVYMAREGLFDDLDAAIDWHPALETQTRNQPGRAMNSFTVEYFGQAAHGAVDPWNGRSALDAVELMNHGVNLMREHVEPTARIHYVIPDGGDAPNVVPEYAKVWYYVRDVNRESVQRYYERILKIAEGAALATGTTHEVSLITGVHECLMNRPLQEVVQSSLELVGGPDLTDEEQEFGRELQRFLEVEEKGFVGEVLPLADEVQPTEGGSTDVCEVSHIVPEVGFGVTTAAAGIPWHSWATTACHGTSGGLKGALVAAQVIALTAAEMVSDPELLAAAKRDFAERTGGRRYQSPIPADQPPPLP